MEIIVGDALVGLAELPNCSVQCCVTSPPYWGLRDYGVGGQIGLESTPELYVAKLVEVFREVRRVLKKDGTLWLNLGDSYASSGQGWMKDGTIAGGPKQRTNFGTIDRLMGTVGNGRPRNYISSTQPNGLKRKDLVGIPWRVAFALQADGWWLRSDIIWSKPNPMPESVTSRPTKSHEYIFLLSKSSSYYYDADAIKEPAKGWHDSEFHTGKTGEHQLGRAQKVRAKEGRNGESAVERKSRGFDNHTGTTDVRNKRTVWTVATQPYKGAHFATFPEKLIEPCILAGCPLGGLVLDPFMGSGTTLAVAKRLGRDAIGIELNESYVELAQARIAKVQEFESQVERLANL